MALRIEKAFGVKMDTLMRMQSSYDIAQTRKRENKIHVRRIALPEAALALRNAKRRHPGYRCRPEEAKTSGMPAPPKQWV
jgi:hypothetical protein